MEIISFIPHIEDESKYYSNEPRIGDAKLYKYLTKPVNNIYLLVQNQLASGMDILMARLKVLKEALTKLLLDIIMI